MKVAAQWRVKCILKNVCQFSCNFRKSWESIARRSSAQRVRRNVKAIQVFVARFRILEHAHVLPQILQVLRGFLEEYLDGFAVHRTHARPSATSSGFCNSSAVGFRYKMQSFRTIAWNFTGILEMDSECPRIR